MRAAAWLTADRARAFAQILLLSWCVLAASIPWTLPSLQVDRDFAAFWTAARLAMDGQAPAAYGDAARTALAALFGPGTYPAFFYPPTALLVWLPFAALPFVVAAALWLAATAAAYVVAVAAIAGRRSIVPALAFPAVLVCALYGQNALLSAALLAGAAASLGRTPVLAGVLVGCLAYKPQLAILAPFAFVAAGRWRAVLAAAATAAILAALSAAAFGLPSWAGFLAVLPEAKAWNADGVAGFDKYASPFAAMRLLGAPVTLAWAVQGAAACAALAALLAGARARPGGAAEVALLVAATGFCVPFLGNYDLVLFAVPGAWLVSEAARTRWLPYERLALGILYVAPLAIIPAASRGVPLAPLALALLLTLVVRRVFHCREPDRP